MARRQYGGGGKELKEGGVAGGGNFDNFSTFMIRFWTDFAVIPNHNNQPERCSMIEKLPMYNLSEIAKTGEIESFAFQELKNDPKKGIAAVIEFRKRYGTIMQNFDQRWVALCEGDIGELTEWASRMRIINSKLDDLDRQLAVANNKRLFQWDVVCSIMGFLNSFRVAAGQVLDFNEPVPA